MTWPSSCCYPPLSGIQQYGELEVDRRMTAALGVKFPVHWEQRSSWFKCYADKGMEGGSFIWKDEVDAALGGEMEVNHLGGKEPKPQLN